MSDLPPPSVEHRASTPTKAPSTYTRRRLAVGAAAVLVVVVIVGGGVMVLGGGDDDGGGDGESWNAMLVADRDGVSIVDADGEKIEELDVDLGTPILQGVRGEHALLADFGAGGAAVAVDVTSGESTATVEAGDDDERIGWLPTSAAPVITMGTSRGGDLTVVDPASGDTIDIAEAADLEDPLLLSDSAFATADGRTVIATDAGSFQTVIVGFDREEPAFAPGQLAAVGEERFVTLQPAGDTAELEFFDLDGENEGTVVVPRPRRVVMLDDSTVVVVTEDGRILRAAAGDDEAEEIGTIDLGDSEVSIAFPLSAAERMIVILDEESVLIDTTTGDEVTRLPGSLWAAPIGEPACFALRDDSTITLYAADDGSQLATAGTDIARVQVVSPVRAGGCTTIVPGTRDAGSTVLSADGERALDGEAIDVAPDGTAAIVRNDRQLQLVRLDDDDAEPIDLDGTSAIFIDR